MIRTFGIVALLAYNTFCFADSDNSSIEGIEVSGFECADESLHVLPYLGRGEDFPKFLVLDINKELKRQNSQVLLSKISCTSAPSLQASVVPIEGDSNQSLLSKLSISFHLDVELKDSEHAVDTTTLVIEHNYFVENLDSDALPKVTQNFIVKN